MAGQAGWYRAPGEEGLLRYWNGTAWTEHRQPAPVSVAVAAPTPPVAPVAPAPSVAPTLSIAVNEPVAIVQPVTTAEPVSVPEQLTSIPSVQSSPFPMPAAQRHLATEPLVPQPSALAHDTETDWSMDQFEKQFEQQFGGSNGSDLPASTNLSAAAEAASDPYAMPASRFAPQQGASLASAPAPTPVQVQSPPVAPAAASGTATTNPAKPSATDIAFAASNATAGVERVRRNRKRVMNPVRGMVVGLLFVLVGVALILISTAQNNPPGGELKANGIITSLGSPRVGCSPIARFAAAGGSYTTAQGAAISPCPVGLGQAVNVFYSAAHPGTTGTISNPSSISTIDWAVTGIGVLLLIGSGVLFIARAGSVSRGVAVIRDGELAEVAASKNRP